MLMKKLINFQKSSCFFSSSSTSEFVTTRKRKHSECCFITKPSMISQWSCFQTANDPCHVFFIKTVASSEPFHITGEINNNLMSVPVARPDRLCDLTATKESVFFRTFWSSEWTFFDKFWILDIFSVLWRSRSSGINVS